MTCLSAARSKLTFRRRFDLCVVDEATQVNLPTVLGPLRFLRGAEAAAPAAEEPAEEEPAEEGGAVSSREGSGAQSGAALRPGVFLLVGDHQQLPPLVQSSTARRAGLDTSLFASLAAAAEERAAAAEGGAEGGAVVTLTRQYRMHEDIMLLSNSLVYTAARGQQPMVCGSASVASRALRLRGLPPQLAASAPQWLRSVVDPKSPVLFLDTDAVTAPAARALSGGPSGSARAGADGRASGSAARFSSNATEAALVRRVVGALVAAGLDPAEIGVISPFRAQIRCIGKLLARCASGAAETGRGGAACRPSGVAGGAWASPACATVEVATVDTYQGREKECIVLSLVRSDGVGEGKGGAVGLGKLLKDVRRMNVALTRAQSKLIIVGSRATLLRSGDAFFGGLLKVLGDPKRSWIVALPSDALAGEGGGGARSAARRFGAKKDEQKKVSQGRTW